jgi:acyl-CoA synthetase (AMP-forming)/AMP-acid ligase II
LVRAQLKEVLAAYKIPKYLLPTRELPRQPSGKGDYRRAQAVIKQKLSV